MKSKQKSRVYSFIDQSSQKKDVLYINIDTPEKRMTYDGDKEHFGSVILPWLRKYKMPVYNFNLTEKENILNFVDEHGWVAPIVMTSDYLYEEIPF